MKAAVLEIEYSDVNPKISIDALFTKMHQILKWDIPSKL